MENVLSGAQPSIKAHRVDCGDAPTGRQGFGSVLLGSDLYVVGGRLDDQQRERVYSNNLWKFSLASKEWTEVKGGPTSSAISKRHNCSLSSLERIIDGKNSPHLYMFGGATEGRDESSYSSDLFSFDLETSAWLKVSLEPGSVWPSARHGHSCASIDPSHMVVFGGRDKMTPARFQNDIWVFNSNLNTWTEVVAFGSKPDGRYFSSMCTLDENRFGIFGGFQWFNHREIYLNDCFIFTFDGPEKSRGTWAKVEMKGKVPSPRNRASLTLVVGPNLVFLFGGNYLVEGKDKFLSDGYLLDLSIGEAVEVRVDCNSKDRKSLARGHHSLVRFENNLWIFGGERYRMRLNDTWLLDLPLIKTEKK